MYFVSGFCWKAYSLLDIWYIFTAERCEGVALWIYTDDILVSVAISGLVAVDNWFNNPTNDLYVSSSLM